jgi:hypothetical protein
MKNLTFKLVLVSILIIGCKKHRTQNEDELAPRIAVTFVVQSFNQQVTKISKINPSVSASNDTLKNYVNYLYYYVYDDAGSLVKSVQQTANTDSFGRIRDELKPGTYTVAFTASKAALAFGGGVSSLSTVHFYNSTTNYWDDTFFRKYSVTVGNTPVVYNVNLDRIVGGLELVLHDPIPNEVSKISIRVELKESVFKVNTGEKVATADKIKDFDIPVSERNVSGKKFLMHILNDKRPVVVHISAYDSDNNLVSQKTVNNVRCLANKITVLSGKLFTNSIGGFIISLNPEWDRNPEAPIAFD